MAAILFRVRWVNVWYSLRMEWEWRGIQCTKAILHHTILLITIVYWTTIYSELTASSMVNGSFCLLWRLMIPAVYNYTPAQRSWRGGILDSPCPSVRLNNRHGRNKDQEDEEKAVKTSLKPRCKKKKRKQFRRTSHIKDGGLMYKDITSMFGKEEDSNNIGYLNQAIKESSNIVIT